ncbi:MAG: hypothetical protein SGJ05_03145 [bacterium]|nr:hypothetical protein [bacterium]
MEMLIAILLWIGCISAPNSYTTQAIDNYATTNEVVVNSVLSSQAQQQVIWNQYGYAVPSVQVINPTE